MTYHLPSSNPKIDGIETTKDCLTDRAGLILFVRYLDSIKIMSPLMRWFGPIRKSRKGIGIMTLLKQLICFFFDGSRFHLTRFDELSLDAGYSAIIEVDKSDMASSHQVKRFFGAFSYLRLYLFRKCLQTQFLWRLKTEKPSIIKLDIDTMVMDNNDAKVREGVQPTYKKKKGFQPLQMTWDDYVVDAVFRGGSKHSNHSDTVIKMVKHMVKLIRTKYQDVPIIVTIDSGFFDQENFSEFEKLGIGYICGGKIYEDIKEFVKNCPDSNWKLYTNGKKEQKWEILPFGDRRGSWNRFRRALYCSPLADDEQHTLKFDPSETVLYTNLGMGMEVDSSLQKAGLKNWFFDETIVEGYHVRGASELVNRALKDFGTEKLPFKRFESNSAFYYFMLIAFNLFQSFQKDVLLEVIPVKSYATTIRRKLIDIAGKIVKTSRKTILKVTDAVFKRLDFGKLWERANLVPIVPLE